jgi:RNA polymerase sigma factor (sigma-70 family)
MRGIESALVDNLQAFIGFARKRVGDAQLAEDVVQESIAKALAADRKPLDAESVVPWFYRILRRSIIDLYRRTDARERALSRFEDGFADNPADEDRRMLCACFRRLLPALPGQYASLIQQLDLDGRSPEAVAATLGITGNNLKVRLHRARKHLRAALVANCKACSKHGCLDCTCGSSA